MCGTNVYLGGTKMGGTKRRWYEKPNICRKLCKTAWALFVMQAYYNAM